MLIIKTIEGFKQVVAPDIDIYEYATATGGTVMDDSEFVEPPKTEEQIKADIAARRYEAEVGGIVVREVFVDTDRDSQALITGAAVSAMLDSTYVCRWKTPDGFVSFSSTALISIAQQVRAHVQSCFDREDTLLMALEGGTYDESMLQEGWPT